MQKKKSPTTNFLLSPLQHPQPLLLLTPPPPAPLPTLSTHLPIPIFPTPTKQLPPQLPHNPRRRLALPAPQNPMPSPTLLQQTQALPTRVSLPIPPRVRFGRPDGRRAVDEEDAGHGESGCGGHCCAGVERAAAGRSWEGEWRGGRWARGFGCAGWAAGLGEAGAHLCCVLWEDGARFVSFLYGRFELCWKWRVVFVGSRVKGSMVNVDVELKEAMAAACMTSSVRRCIATKCTA